MSLILQGIDLPKQGETIFMILRKDEVKCQRWEDIDDEYETPVENLYTKAIQIPKGHGRLIDGDKLNKSVHMWNPAYTYGRSAFTREINNAPTILGAEGAE